MAESKVLAERIRTLLETHSYVTEKRMFGGLAFLINGNMAIAASGKGGILVRVKPDKADAFTADPAVETAVMRGRQMRGWLRVTDAGLRTKRQLQRWVELGVEAANALPPK